MSEAFQAFESSKADCSSGIVVDRTFALGGADMCARLFVDHCCVNVSIRVLNFVIGLNREIINEIPFKKHLNKNAIPQKALCLEQLWR